MKKDMALLPAQRQAAAPDAHVWVSASAGTGKTQVLTTRVMRLLLEGVAPHQILCLTFTRAAAAEMQARIYETLSEWLHAPDERIDSALAGRGLAPTPALRDRARQLFATVLEARGGLRIQTLHSFAQSLLAAFPAEADIPAGFTALDDRSIAHMQKKALIDLVVEAQDSADHRLLDDLAHMAIHLGDSKAQDVAAQLLKHGAAIAALGPVGLIEGRVRGFLDLPQEGDATSILAARLGDADIPRDLLKAMMEGYSDKTASNSARKIAQTLAEWLAAPPATRAEMWPRMEKLFFTDKGLPKQLFNPLKNVFETDYAMIILWARAIAEVEKRIKLAAHVAIYLRVGARLQTLFVRQKQISGGLQFDEQIARAAELLSTPGMGEWVRYKLDQGIDHILVDEAQDTNADQWAIINAIAEEYFAGQGAVERQRTIFAVGDFKQAIFSFQGTDPAVFEEARAHYRQQADAADQPFRDIPLSDSFRSTPAVLAVVDQLIANEGAEIFGLRDKVPEHHPARGDICGAVVLWAPVRVDQDTQEEDGQDAPDEDAPEGEDGAGGDFIPQSYAIMAEKLAEQIKQWVQGPERLYLEGKGRYVTPGDILILVRKRGNFVPLLIAELHAAHIAVAGADRLRLLEPLSVQDCLALMRFALQPGDDVSLATLLVSPFLGWSQQMLYDHAHARTSSLWRQLRNSDTKEAQAAVAWLNAMLDIADYLPPFEFLQAVLHGPLGGMEKLLARLGPEARDPVEALMAQALAYESEYPPSLQGFLAWVEGDTQDLKRDPEGAGAYVRIMTVHGAKGLQAPVVILADAVSTDRTRPPESALINIEGARVPAYAPSALRCGPVAAAFAQEAAMAAQEDARLLYVALTRAEDMLFVGGALRKSREAPVPSSWHARVERALKALEATPQEDARWQSLFCYQRGSVRLPLEDKQTSAAEAMALPHWVRADAPAERTPPKPLAPSQLGRDTVAAPPPNAQQRGAARRGSLMHSLFEKLPGLAPALWAERAEQWLARQAADLPPELRAQMQAQVLGLMDNPAFAPLFAPEALREAPLTAVVGGQVIAGAVDCLAVGPESVWLADFKTGLAIPARLEDIPQSYVLQMAAYKAALARIFPGKSVRASLIYTAGPRCWDLPADLLDGALAAIEAEAKTA